MVTACKKQFMDRTLTFPMSSVVNNRRWTMRALVILWLLCMVPQFAAHPRYTSPPAAATPTVETSVHETIAEGGSDATQQAGTSPPAAATPTVETSVHETEGGSNATQQAGTSPPAAATTTVETSVNETEGGSDATQQAGISPPAAATTTVETSVNETEGGSNATQQAGTSPSAAATTTVETSVKTKPPPSVSEVSPSRESSHTTEVPPKKPKTINSKTEQSKSVTIKIAISNLKSKLNKSRRRKKDATLDENDVKEIWREQYEQEFLNKVAEVTRKATGNEKFPQPEDIYYIDPTPLVVGNQLLVSFAIKYPGMSAEVYMDGSIVYDAMKAETKEFQSQLGISFEIEQGHNNVTPTSAPPKPIPPLILVILLLVAFLCLIIIIVGMMYLLCDKHLSSRRGEYITNCTVNNDSELGFDNPAMEEKDSNNAHLLGLRSDSEAQMIAPIGDFSPDQLRDYEVEDTHL